YSEVRKGMCIDGHERADVMAYREKFLKKIAKFEACMVVFSGENMEKETRPDFDNIIILVTHDECIFSAYNRRHWPWLPKGEQPLRKKGQGWSVHISEFLTDIEACVITYPSKDAQFPSAKALFVFDNATSHCAYAKNALLAKNMNLSPGGKQPKM
ncbi:17055_t:CDS:2, partial [Dentiscutata heterogama]